VLPDEPLEVEDGLEPLDPLLVLEDGLDPLDVLDDG